MTGPRLAELTTLRVGGAPLRYLAPATEAELVAAASTMLEDPEPHLVLAGGSNVVASDDGFPGTVLHVVTRGIERIDSADGLVHLRVQAGEPWDGLVADAVANGWSGIEALSGIPGSVGATPVQNVGAYGVEVASVLVGVDVVAPGAASARRLPASELGLAYRSSIFKRGFEGVIVAVEFALTPSLVGSVAYDQLAAVLGTDVGHAAPIAEIREQVLALRRSKGMLLDPADHDSWGVGSFFTNPIVSESLARTLPEDAPRWPVAPSEQPDDGPVLVKLSAAWLIEHVGIRRGFALAGSRAGISSKHTLAITNRGGATAAEVMQLAVFVQSRVAADFGVLLAPEPVIV